MKRTCLLLGLVLLPLIAVAQEGTLEFGIDADVGYILTDDRNGFDVDDLFVVSVPVSGFRFGYFVTDQLSIEPAVAFDFISSDGDSFLDLSFGVGALYHFNPDPARTRAFVSFSPTIRFVDAGDSSSSQFGLVGQVGVKAPLKGPLAAKVAAGVKRDFENDDFFVGATTIFASFGLSFFVNR